MQAATVLLFSGLNQVQHTVLDETSVRFTLHRRQVALIEEPFAFSLVLDMVALALRVGLDKLFDFSDTFLNHRNAAVAVAVALDKHFPLIRSSSFFRAASAFTLKVSLSYSVENNIK